MEDYDQDEKPESGEQPAATTAQVETTTTEDAMAKKKKSGKKVKSAKTLPPAKSRTKTPPTGAILGVKSVGKTYIHLEFSDGIIVLSPTSNREVNRDVALKALRALVKG